MLTGNAFACLGPNDPFRRVDIFQSDYICEWWRILNLSVFAGAVGAVEGLRSVVLLTLSPLVVAAVTLVLFMGAFVLVRRDAGQDAVADTAIGPRESVVELRQRGAGSSSAENAAQSATRRPDEEEAAAYVAFQQICTIACVGAAGVALFILVPAYAGGKSRLECPGIRRVTSSRLLHAVPGVLEVGAACAVGVFAYWLRRVWHQHMCLDEDGKGHGQGTDGTRYYFVKDGECSPRLPEERTVTRGVGEGISIVAVRGRRLKWESRFPRLPADPALVVWNPAGRSAWLASGLVALVFVSGAGPNAVYVVLSTLSDVPGSVKSISTVVLAAVKTACNAVLIPRVAWMLGKRGMGATMSLREIRERAQTLGICFLLVNTFVWPLGAVMFASPVCFRNMLVHPPAKTSW